MRRDRRTREQRKADASARIAAACLFLAALLIIVATLTVKTTGQPYKGEPPVIEDKLPGEDKPAEGSAVIDIGEPLGEFRLTAYCPCAKCCGKWANGITATGTTATEGRTIAVDPALIPYGATVTVYFADGTSHTYTAEDCGGAIKENRIDVFFDDHQAAREFGVQTAYVYMEENNG
nr:MAG TPA: lytic transglycosylase [Caudoviricetes sp.]